METKIEQYCLNQKLMLYKNKNWKTWEIELN